MKEFKAPNRYSIGSRPSLFLAGSIEMGKAINWQKTVCAALEDEDVVILNPRRDHWDSTWVQRIANKEFTKQVNWELDALERASVILFYFAPETMSPITLLELGLHKDKKIFVCCPDGYWRKGNIEVVCKRFKIPLFNSIEPMLNRVRKEIRKTR